MKMSNCLRKTVSALMIQAVLTGFASAGCLECRDGENYMPITLGWASRNFWEQYVTPYGAHTIRINDEEPVSLIEDDASNYNLLYLQGPSIMTLTSPHEYRTPVSTGTNPVVTVQFNGRELDPEEPTNAYGWSEEVSLKVGACYTKIKIVEEGEWVAVPEYAISHWLGPNENAKVESGGLVLELPPDETQAFCAAFNLDGDDGWVLHYVWLSRGQDADGSPVCWVSVNRIEYMGAFITFLPSTSDFSIEFMQSDDKGVGE